YWSDCGENITEVANQPESYELLQFNYGFITTSEIKGIKIESLHPHESNLVAFLKSAKSYDSVQSSSYPNNYYQEKVVFIVTRVEYANLYHSMTDWYNTFLVMKLLNLSSSNIHILLTDGHPIGGLDEVWYKLFHSVSRIGVYRRQYNDKYLDKLHILPMNEKGLLNIGKIVFIPYGYASPLYVDNNNNNNNNVINNNMFIEEFRNFIIENYQLNNEINICKNKKLLEIYLLPKIIIISRQNYNAHPRNMKGVINRKIINEKELLFSIKQLGFNNSLIINLINLNIYEQIKLISTTDILIGMHGAGLTYTLLLPKISYLIELFPAYCCISNKHFRKFSQLHGIMYSAYYGLPKNDKDIYSSYIPVNDFKKLVLHAYQLWKNEMIKKHRNCMI
ncbi:unnamed protein product, partial [Heterobilharzia americana]